VSDTPHGADASGTPLYEQTLSDLLLVARQQAQKEVFRHQHAAARQVAEAHARADRLVREERLRRVFLAEEVEERVRASLAAAPPLPPLVGRLASVDAPVEEVEREAPPVPPLAELMRPTPGVTRFLDALLGPSDA